jgi:VIT1/CCC1 family predicted Fe2+/Mn2+ transporter
MESSELNNRIGENLETSLDAIVPCLGEDVVSRREAHPVARIKMAPMYMVAVGEESIRNLKEWSLVSHLLGILGGVLIGVFPLLLDPGVEKTYVILAFVVGLVMISLAVIVERRKFNNFIESIRNSGIELGVLSFSHPSCVIDKQESEHELNKSDTTIT